MQLYLDQREQQLLPLFPDAPHIVKKTLQTGDFMISFSSSFAQGAKEGSLREEKEDEESILYLFERKTLKDLSASLKDGRFVEQKKRLLEIAKTTKVFYIIEGSLGYSPETLIEGIAFSKLNAAINKIYIEGLGVVRTKDKQGTVDFLLNFFKSVQKHHPQNVTGGSITEVTEKKEVSNEEYKEKIFKALPGIGETLLPSFKNLSLADLFKMPLYELENIKYTSGRKIGKRAADIMYALIPGYTREFELLCKGKDRIECIKTLKGDNKASIKVLAEFPGISKKTAEFILKDHSLAEIIFTEPHLLQDFLKTPSRKIGPVIAKKINALAFFH